MKEKLFETQSQETGKKKKRCEYKRAVVSVLPSEMRHDRKRQLQRLFDSASLLGVIKRLN